MNEPYVFDEMQIDVLREIGNIGAGHAATALSLLLGMRIEMEVPRANLVGFNEIALQIGGSEAVIVSVFLQVMGDAPGNMFFMVSLDTARQLLDQLNLPGRENATERSQNADDVAAPPTFTDIEVSAISEIGNILAGSYLSSLAEFTQLNLEPSPPAFTLDMAGAILAYALIQIGNMGDQALLIETAFFDGVNRLQGNFFFIPEPESLPIMFKSLGITPK